METALFQAKSVSSVETTGDRSILLVIKPIMLTKRHFIPLRNQFHAMTASNFQQPLNWSGNKYYSLAIIRCQVVANQFLGLSKQCTPTVCGCSLLTKLLSIS